MKCEFPTTRGSRGRFLRGRKLTLTPGRSQGAFFKLPEYQDYLQKAVEVADVSELSPPLLIEFHKKLTRSAAQHALDSLIVHHPRSPLAGLIILKTRSRALWHQDVKLANRLQRTHWMGRKYLLVDVQQVSVSLLEPTEFFEATDAAQQAAAHRAAAEVRQNMQPDTPGKIFAKHRRRLR
eukprot:683145-Pyramimonas_sp.AAC.1